MYTCSVHAASNFPARKVRTRLPMQPRMDADQLVTTGAGLYQAQSDRDVALPDGTGDEAYLQCGLLLRLCAFAMSSFACAPRRWHCVLDTTPSMLTSNA